jgi:hypothetical protein
VLMPETLTMPAEAMMHFAPTVVQSQPARKHKPRPAVAARSDGDLSSTVIKDPFGAAP